MLPRGRGIRRVVMGMSGGVDSAVAGALLTRNRPDLEVIGVHMENWDVADEGGDCRRGREQDLSDARESCAHLGIPFTTVSFIKEYWNEVFSSLLSDYERGFTPNPDVLCNRHLKFGSFFRYAQQVWGADYIATGHYAQTAVVPVAASPSSSQSSGGGVRLLRALDATKDQTLFLSGVDQVPLSHTLFPLGALYKSQVRRIAGELGLEAVAKKRDSVGICFIGVRSFSDFISEYLPNAEGHFIELETGGVIGSHPGVHHYTIGQRCRLPGRSHAWYVAARDPETRTIYVVSERDHPALYSNTFLAEEPHWIYDVPEYSEERPFLCMFKFQHTEWTTPALLYKVKGQQGDPGPVRLKVWLSIPTRAVTPGQISVFYQGNVCLGSAKILWVDVLSKIGLRPPFPLPEDQHQGVHDPSVTSVTSTTSLPPTNSSQSQSVVL